MVVVSTSNNVKKTLYHQMTLSIDTNKSLLFDQFELIFQYIIFLSGIDSIKIKLFNR